MFKILLIFLCKASHSFKGIAVGKEKQIEFIFSQAVWRLMFASLILANGSNMQLNLSEMHNRSDKTRRSVNKDIINGCQSNIYEPWAEAIHVFNDIIYTVI